MTDIIFTNDVLRAVACLNNTACGYISHKEPNIIHIAEYNMSIKTVPGTLMIKYWHTNKFTKNELQQMQMVDIGPELATYLKLYEVITRYELKMVIIVDKLIEVFKS